MTRVQAMSNRVVHFEVPFDDGDRARSFYGEAFGWSFHDALGRHYVNVEPGPVDEDGRPVHPGSINGGLLRRESPTDRPMVTIQVDDIEAALAKIEEAGGTVVLSPQHVADYGKTAYFKDTEGNQMGLWEPA